HLYGLWAIPQWMSIAERGRVEAQFADLYPGAARIEGHRARYLAFLSARSGWFLLGKRIVLACLGIASLAGLVIPLVRLTERESVTWFCASLTLHGALLLVAAFNVAHWRYSIVWWPYGLLAVGLARRRLAGAGAPEPRAAGKTFEFGRNWTDFLRVVDEA